MTSFTAYTANTSCANCNKAESDDIKLKTCTACKLVKYCSRQCQAAHRPQHKNMCKKRVEELFDAELFKDPPKREECPICTLPLPFESKYISFESCCGKLMCLGCVHAQLEQRSEDCRGVWWICAYCRTPNPRTDKENIDRLNRCVERDNAYSMLQLGDHYSKGSKGLQKDLTKAMDLFLEAGKLGCAAAYDRVGHLYRDGECVEKDMKKAKYYYELGAIGGSISARHNLACFDFLKRNFSRAYKHYLISAKAGYEPSLKAVKSGYIKGHVSKDAFAETLRAYQKQHDETKSATREKAVVVLRRLPSLQISIEQAISIGESGVG